MSLLVASALQAPATAIAEGRSVPAGTVVILPDGAGPSENQSRLLDAETWLLTRREIEAFVVLDADMERCRTDLSRCEADLRGVAPTPGFFSTPAGKGLVIGGFVVTAGISFAAGLVVATPIQFGL